MASSSKRGPSSSKQSSAGKARVISVKRTDALPRKGNVSTGRRKPVVQPLIDAPMEPLATAVARSNKKSRSLQQAETTASRTKTTRAAGRSSSKLNKPVTAVEAFAGVETEVEASAIVEETTIVEAAFALPAPVAPAPHHAKRAFVTVVSGLLSTLWRWTGVRL